MDCCCIFNLPPGFRFRPTDEELVHEYLLRKCAYLPLPAPIAADVDLYKFDPWDLPAMATYGEKEWYFFSPRDRKYPNGSRPDRAAACGHWKATGIDKPIGKPKALGIKKGLCFYVGKSPQGIKTNWIMHEYRLANVDRSNTGKKSTKRLDDWVLCKIYNKKGEIEKYTVGEPGATPSIEQLPNPLPANSLSSGNSEAHMAETSGSVPKLRGESRGSGQRSMPECSEDVRGGSEWEEFEEELEKGLGFSMEDFLDDNNDFFEEETENNQNIMDEFPPVPDAFPFPQRENTQQKPF